MWVLEILVIIIGVMGIIVIAWGAFITFVRLIVTEYLSLVRHHPTKKRESLRVMFGIRLLLGLEFLIAADVIRTVMDPTLTEIAILASIVAIRTVISFFLDREIAHVPPELRED